MRTRASGYTLIELMFSILLLSVLFGLAVPAFKNFTSSTKVSAATNGLVSALALARNEAVHLATPVSVCATSDGSTCITAAPAAGNWNNGWIVFTDSGTAGDIDGTDAILQVWPAQGSTTVSADQDYVRYDSRGLMLPLGRTVTATISATSGCTGNQANTVVVGTVGSTQTTKSTPCP
jgi:type IV fimbrial biogenesis protein FimT